MHVDSPSTEGVRIPTFTNTPYGFYSRLPILQTPSGPVAVLFSSIGDEPLGLALRACPEAIDPTLPLYHTTQPDSRLVRIGPLLRHRAVTAQDLKNVYFAHRPKRRAEPFPRSLALINGGIFAPFRIPEAHLRALARDHSVQVLRVTDAPFPWTGTPPVALALESSVMPARKYFWVITLGRCTVGAETSVQRPGAHWATMQQCNYQYNALPDAPPMPSHSCQSDHISGWADGRKTFKAYYPGWIPVILSFTPCRMNPTGETLVLNLEFRPPVRSGSYCLPQGGQNVATA